MAARARRKPTIEKQLMEARRKLASSGCGKPRMETIFNFVVHGLFLEQRMPDGDVLDVGASDGTWACMYACMQPKRTVRAMDPSTEMLRRLNQSCRQPNVRSYLGAVSNVSGFVQNTNRFYIGTLNVSAGGNVPLFTIDRLFEQWRSTLGFAHLDLEGYELDAVRGGATTLARDRPIVSTEVHVGQPSARDVFDHFKSLDYQTFVIQEKCGVTPGCRNLLNIPNELLVQLRDSPVLNLALHGDMLIWANSAYFAAQRSKQLANSTRGASRQASSLHTWLHTTIVPEGQRQAIAAKRPRERVWPWENSVRFPGLKFAPGEFRSLPDSPGSLRASRGTSPHRGARSL